MAAAKISEGVREQAYQYYARHKGITLNAIAILLGVDRGAFWRLRRQWGWPPRHEALASSALNAAHENVAPALETPGFRSGMREAASTLAHVTCARLNALVREQGRGPETDHDRVARTLAAYARTLTIARSLLEQEETEGHDADLEAQPRSLHDLRDELAAHLERIVAEEQAVGSDGLLV